jgi:NADPH:quinone reductase-like Zn-dependent oxidoreductase
MEEAAAFSITSITAHLALMHIGRLQKGESILIHSAAGGTGQSAIMLAQDIGAEVFATVGTLEKRKFLREQYNIPDDHIFHSRDASFEEGVCKQTNGRGVDVVLNSLAGPLYEASMRTLTAFGRFVDIGKVDMHAARRLNMSLMSRNISVSAVDLVAYSESPTQRRVIRDAGSAMLSAYLRKTVRAPVPQTPFSVSSMGDALALLGKGTHTGKIVIKADAQDNVRTVPRVPILDLGSKPYTHLVVGATTGVGLSIAKWLIANGARHVAAVSRHAEESCNADVLRQEADRVGGHVLVRNCDVSDPNALANLVRAVKQLGFPPIRGVIQGGMVLDVSSGMTCM